MHWLLLALAAVSGGVLGGDHLDVELELPRPTRKLEWKEINVLSISDSHGEELSCSHR